MILNSRYSTRLRITNEFLDKIRVEQGKASCCSKSLDGWELRKERILRWARMRSYVLERGCAYLENLH